MAPLLPLVMPLGATMQKTRGSLMEPTLTTIAYFLFAGFAVGLAVGGGQPCSAKVIQATSSTS